MTCQLLQDDLLGYGWLMRVVQPYMRQGVGRRGGRVGAVSAMVLGSRLNTATTCHHN